ncbi:Phosphoribosyl transferase [Gracilaria domingensis]|nr:Phosphoribosyl transferase [Gracilaria domingensis]
MESGGPVPPEWVGSVSEVLIGSADIAKRVSQLGKTISSKYEGLNPLFVVVLKGSYMFASDLSRSMNIPHELEFIRASSYDGTESSGKVRINGLQNTKLYGRHVIVIEDIVDTGLTLSRLYAHFEGAGAATIKTCSFLEKETVRRKADVPTVDFVAFHIPDKFVIGYGLDYEQQYRHLPFVGVYKQ